MRVVARAGFPRREAGVFRILPLPVGVGHAAGSGRKIEIPVHDVVAVLGVCAADEPIIFPIEDHQNVMREGVGADVKLIKHFTLPPLQCVVVIKCVVGDK